ncbi:type IV toxin-antitoxin system AbiEi family antitoxin [Oerskovia turbata]
MDDVPIYDPDVADRIRRALSAHGVELHLDDTSATFEIDGRALRRSVMWLDNEASARPPRSSRQDLRDLIFLANRIRPSMARWIRERGGWFADGVGSAYVRAPGVVIDVDGRPLTSGHTSASSGRRTRNLVSAGRAQVVFALLTWPELVERSMKEIGEASGVSSSLAHTAMSLLEQEHYLSASSRRLERRHELIDLWAAAYPFGLARSIELGRFVGDPTPHAWADLGRRVYASGEYATERLSGPDLVLYAPALETRAIAQSRWRRPEPREQANIIVRRAFWKDPDERGREPGVDVAPRLLVYGDLLASNDPRQREVAAAMREAL